MLDRKAVIIICSFLLWTILFRLIWFKFINNCTFLNIYSIISNLWCLIHRCEQPSSIQVTFVNQNIIFDLFAGKFILVPDKLSILNCITNSICFKVYLLYKSIFERFIILFWLKNVNFLWSFSVRFKSPVEIVAIFCEFRRHYDATSSNHFLLAFISSSH